jgi:ketosteroid isomerase-like protein
MKSKYGSRRCFLRLLGLSALAACRSISADPNAVLFDADRAFAQDVQRHRLEAWVEWFDANGSQVDPQFRPITGHDAIQSNMAELFSDPNVELDWEPDLARISEAGGLGLTSGRFRLLTHHPDGSVNARTGRYFDVWRKQPDGSWKVLYDLGDLDPQ